MTITIPLSNGLHALVDDADVALVEGYRWHACISGYTTYAVRDIWLPEQHRNKKQSMHQLITGYERTDHRNGDGLDNRRSNLRPASRSQNLGNQRKTRGTSRFKGVSWYWTGRWTARIKFRGKQVHLGYFLSEEEAAIAYDHAARIYFGEFAAINFPQPGERSALGTTPTIGEAA